MIKGCKRSIVMLKNTGSEVIEQAYFVLAEEAAEKKSKSDILSEAKRILQENKIAPSRAFLKKRERRKQMISRLIFFILGTIVGVLIMTMPK